MKGHYGEHQKEGCRLDGDQNPMQDPIGPLLMRCTINVEINGVLMDQ